MNEKTFLSPSGRSIVIKVTDDHICFYYADDFKRTNEWIKQEEDSGREVSDDDKKVGEFYWIDKKNWIDDFTQRLDREDNFHRHMKAKVWFTDEMYLFINKCCGV